jgi:hypothetical protein
VRPGVVVPAVVTDTIGVDLAAEPCKP